LEAAILFQTRNSVLIENNEFKLFCIDNSYELKLLTEIINFLLKKMVAKRF